MTELAGEFSKTGRFIATGRCGIVAGTLVQTLDGLLPVEFLEPGDRVVCRQGARRLLRSVVSCHDSVALVRIRASTLGHDRPDRDLLLAPDQPVLIRDWRAKALFGLSVAAVSAIRLIDGEFILTEIRQNARLYALHFAEDEVIYAEGIEIACLAIEPASKVVAD